jgi:hypothetical protein
MTQRFIEFAIKTQFPAGRGRTVSRMTLDLDSVRSFYENFFDNSVTLEYHSGHGGSIPMSYDDFKKLHQDYQNSKNPPQVIPSEQEPPCTHPQISRATWNDISQCNSCGKLFPVPCNVELPKLSTAKEIASSTIMETKQDPDEKECPHPRDKIRETLRGDYYCSLCGRPLSYCPPSF